MSKRQIILASGSPRRKRLLKQIIGDNFEVIESPYEEDNTLDVEPMELARRHAFGKAQAVAEDLESGIVIGCDTFGLIDGEILGKPEDEADARAMLRRISGRTLTVVSGLVVLDLDAQKTFEDSELSEVTMKEMTDGQIQAYVATGEPLDKAAAFATQGKGAVLVKEIDGDYFNVVGLPLYKLGLLLEKAGVDVFSF